MCPLASTRWWRGFQYSNTFIILHKLHTVKTISRNFKRQGQAYFNAKVLEINKEYVDVRCIEAFNSGISVDEEFSVTKDVVSAEGVPELNVDDNIRVVFNGDVMESDPLQIGTVYAIYLLDENGEAIPNN